MNKHTSYPKGTIVDIRLPVGFLDNGRNHWHGPVVGICHNEGGRWEGESNDWYIEFADEEQGHVYFKQILDRCKDAVITFTEVA